MATSANPPPGATATNGSTNDPFTSTPSHAHPAPLRYAPFDNDQFASYSTNSPSQARRALEAHLRDTDRRIQDASKLGTTLLQQRKDLAGRLKDVEDIQKDNEVPSDLRQKLAELEKEYNEVGRESARAFLPKSRSVTTDSVPTVFSSQARDSPSKASAPSRRQRNQPANRFHDIEFATEISTQLLAQVRQLQAALSEKDEELQNVTSRKTQLEDEHTNVLQRLKHSDGAIQGYKDEQWNLETKIQDMEASLRESGNTEQRLNNIIKTTQFEKSTAQRELEDLRVVHDKAVDEHATVQRQQEGDLHTLRRDVANHENEKLSFQRKIEELTGQNTELAKAVSYRLMNQGSQHFQPGSKGDRDSNSDDDADMDHSDPTSPIKGTPARAGMLESETLKSSLNHAHRMIQNLKNNIHREKTDKLELKRMLSDARDELEKKRETGAGGITAANMSKKRRSEAETVKFRKPSRPERLGASRAATTEILEDEPDWEDHEDQATPSKSRIAAPAAAGAAAASAIMPGAFTRTDTDSSDAFETADERSRETATETEAFQTGAESLGEDSDELTETESNIQRSGTIRKSASPNTAARPIVTRDMLSYMSTASTSADESDDEVVRTPVQNQAPKYRVRVSRGPNSRNGRPSDLFSDSPASSVGTGTPQPAGKSLGDELDALDDEDDVEGTPDSRHLPSSRTASPETTRMASVEPELPSETDRSLSEPIQSIEGAENDEFDEKPMIGSPFSSPVKSPKPEGEKSVLAHQANSAMLAHEIAISKPAMVDAGMMTEPWAPEKEIVVQHVAADEAQDEDAHKSLRQRAGDVVGGALAGFGLGRLGGSHDAETPKEEVETAAEPKSIDDDPVAPGVDPDLLAEPKTLSNRASVYGIPRGVDAGGEPEEPSAVYEPSVATPGEYPDGPGLLSPRETHVAPVDEPKVLRSSMIEPLQSPQQPSQVLAQQQTVPLTTSAIMTQETEPVEVPTPILKEAQPVAFGISGVHTQDTEPVEVPAPVAKEAQPVEFGLSGVNTQDTEPVSPPRPRPEAPRQTSSRGLQGLTDAASRDQEALAAAGVAGAAGAMLGARSTEHKPEPLGFSSVESQDLEPMELHSTMPTPITPLVPRRSSRRMDELYAVDASPGDFSQATDSEIPGTTGSRPGAGYFAGQAPPLIRSRSKSMPAHELQRTRVLSEVLDAIEPRVYGGGKGSGNIPTLIFGSDDDHDQMPITKAPSVRTPDVPTTKIMTPDSEGLIPATEPLKIRKPMSDGGSQTEVSGDEIERMIRDKSAPSTGLSLGAGALAGAGAGYIPGHSPRRSVDAAIAPNDSPLRAPRRPASSGSMRNKASVLSPPPLPEDHTLKIAAAGGRPAQPTTPGQVASGSMGPPTMPASAYRHSHQPRPKTPVGGHGAGSVSRSISKEGTTPRPPRTHASPSGVSRRTSVSSFASELDERFNIQRGQFAYPDDLPPTTDPRMIQAITQTMIGEYLWKYTRKAGRSETSTTRHRRFFWVHPYTRTLYWSEKDPSTAGQKMMKAKSLPIESVRVITDDNAYPPGLHRKSLVVITPGREIVFTAPTGQRHETWFNALSYLLLRTEHERAEQDDTLDEEELEEFNPPTWSIRRSISRMTGRSNSRQSFASRNSSPVRKTPAAADTPTLTSRPSRLTTQTPTLRPTPAPAPGSMTSRTARDSSAGGRMSSFTSKFRHGSMRGSFTSSRPGAASAMSHRSGRTEGSEAVPAGPEIYNASVVSDSAEDLRAVIERQERDADRVENVRACCDGKHDVGSLASHRGGRHGSFMGRTAGHTHAHQHAHPRAEPIKDAGRPRRGE